MSNHLGSIVNRIRVEDAACGLRGIVAAEHIPCGEPVVKIPKKTAISVQKAKLSAQGEALAKQHDGATVPDRTVLQAYLISLRHGCTPTADASPELLATWQSYLRDCPAGYSNPVVWCQASGIHPPQSQDQGLGPQDASQGEAGKWGVESAEASALVASLEGTQVLQKALLVSKAEWIQYTRFVAPLVGTELFPTEAFDWPAWIWAWSTVASRAFPSELVGEADTVGCLLPVVDLLNHRFGAKVTWFHDAESVSLLVDHPVPVGSVIWNNYGPKSNHELLFHYG